MRHAEDDQPDEPADQRAVDADILQVAADLQLDAFDQRLGIPVLHHLADEGGDLGPARRDRAQESDTEPAVDTFTDALIRREPLTRAQQSSVLDRAASVAA